MLLNDAQRAAVCRILAGELGQAVQLEDVQPASAAGHRGVSRVTVGGAPSTWIVKTSRQQSGFDLADPTHAQPWGFFSELVGAAFVSSLEGEPPLSPRCVGAAPGVGVIVLEDLGSGHDLADLLLGSDREAAEQGMQDFGRALGRLHARAAGREAEYGQLWRTVVPDPARPPLAAWQLPAGVQALREVTAQLGMATGVSVEADLRTLAATLDESVLRTYVHGDPCPDNVRPGGGGRLLDFQGGGFGSALLDGVYARMPFPTCWCTGRLPDEVVARFEAAYRQQLVDGLPAARDAATFDRAEAAACAYWFLVHVKWRLRRALDQSSERPEVYRSFVLPPDREHVLLRAEAFVATARRLGHLEALANLAAALVTVLRQRWQDVLRDVPLYPAFQETAPSS